MAERRSHSIPASSGTTYTATCSAPIFRFSQSSSPAPPTIWGVNYRRWVSFREHIHYVLAGANGTEMYGATSVEEISRRRRQRRRSTGNHARENGQSQDVAEVKRVFLFPSLWDLIVWVKTNPNGAFADKNPLVTPSANAGKDDM